MTGGPRVLITRPRDFAIPFAGKVEALGYHPVVAPLTALMPTGQPIPPEPFSALIVTSQSAIRFLPATGHLKHTPVYTVGAHTAAVCRESGFADVTCGGEDVESLLQTLQTKAGRLGVHPILYASGTRVSHDLPALLKPAGFDVVRIPVYTTTDLALSEEAIRLLCSGAIAWITLFSRHTAAVLAGAVDRLTDRDWTNGVALACLAPGIAQEAGRFRWRNVETAALPTETAMLDCLAKRLADG